MMSLGSVWLLFQTGYLDSLDKIKAVTQYEKNKNKTKTNTDHPYRTATKVKTRACVWSGIPLVWFLGVFVM